VNGSAVITATKDLGVRFRLVGLLPAAVLALFVLGLVWSGAPGRSPDLREVAAHAERVKAWSGFLLALAVLAAAVIAEPLQLTLIRGLEGYWGESWVGRLFAAPGTAFHRARRRRLDRRQQRRGDDRRTASAREAAARKLRAYPPAAAVLPTKLGNVLRAAEYRAGARYGLETATAWPRLYPVLSDRVAAGLDDLRDQLDLSVRFCAIFLTATVISAALLAQYGWWLSAVAGTFMLAVLSYQAAVGAAGSYGQAMAAAFDLHRFDLLTAMHLPLPADLISEVRANEELSSFLQQPHEYLYALTSKGQGINFRYEQPNQPTGGGTTELPAVPAKAAELRETPGQDGCADRDLNPEPAD
jgi:hypothetical protein